MKFKILEKTIVRNKKDNFGKVRDFARFKIEIDNSLLWFKNNITIVDFDFYKIISWFPLNGELLKNKIEFYQYRDIRKVCEDILYQEDEVKDFNLEDIFNSRDAKTVIFDNE